MDEYRKLNLSKINFDKEEISYDDAIKNPGILFSLPNDTVSRDKHTTVKTAEQGMIKKQG